MRKEIGKITRAELGMGGYQDAMMGVTFQLEGRGWGTTDFAGTWAEWREGCKWTTADQMDQFAEAVVKVRELLKDANKTNLSQLVGIPVEATFKDNRLSSWRILTEVL